MGNVLAFRREGDLVALDLPSNRRSASSESNDRLMDAEAGIPRCVRAGKSTLRPSTNVFKRFGWTRFVWGIIKARRHPNPNAYLLVLLADQELTAGRNEEARSLLNAAYAAFDHRLCWATSG